VTQRDGSGSAYLANEPEDSPRTSSAPTVLQVHNYYEHPGGEDQVVRAERALLRQHGHRVEGFEAHHDDLRSLGKLALARKAIWNRDSYDRVRASIRSSHANVVHVHNTVPLISPSVYDAARAEGAAVVQTLHNYRLLCPSGDFLRDGQVCRACLGRSVAWPSVVHACYRGDRAASAVLTTMLAIQRARGTIDRKVDAYVVMTEFARRLFVDAGFPEDRVVVKPHFVDPDPGPGDGRGGYALFVGRLAPEKGIEVLLRAWERLGRTLPLKILGDGPLAPVVAEAATRIPGVEWLGHGDRARVLAAMGEAAVVVAPSIWYETFGLVVIEALSRGTPVVVSSIGAIAELVDHGRTGRLALPGDADDLADQVEALVSDAARLEDMRHAARAAYLATYTGPANYARLLDVYRGALAVAARAPAAMLPG
jgi:glycosyltransferase involved in cell wall biosynthesis